VDNVIETPAPAKGLDTKANGIKHGRGRPRSEHSHEAILIAVLALLEKEGYQGITIEGVAREAGVGKQTIYRWWRCRAELVLEAYANHAASKVPVPDKGSVQADLETFLMTAFRRLTNVTGSIMRGLMADAVLDPEFGGILRDVFLARRREAIQSILEKGIARGELRSDVEPEVITDMIMGPMWYRLLTQPDKLDAAFARKLVRMILQGSAART
jgi:AcrR family transcriptional regulator